MKKSILLFFYLSCALGSTLHYKLIGPLDPSNVVYADKDIFIIKHDSSEIKRHVLMPYSPNGKSTYYVEVLKKIKSNDGNAYAIRPVNGEQQDFIDRQIQAEITKSLPVQETPKPKPINPVFGSIPPEKQMTLPPASKIILAP